MHRINNVVTLMVFGKLLGDMRTLLPIRPAVTYVYTLPWASVSKHTSHPIT